MNDTAFKLLKKTTLVSFFLSLTVFIVTFFLKNRLPPSQKINTALYQEPLQTAVDLEEIEVVKDNAIYEVQPLYEYELYGLVVADYNSENAFDFAHKLWNDSLNSKDLCVIWGNNVKRDDYLDVSFSHGEWTCYYRYYSNTIQFNGDELSNNHLLPQDEQVYKQIMKASVGDQIHLKGYLSSYAWKDTDGRAMSRGTSTVRDDTGNGACETIYVNQFEILEKGNEFATILNQLSLYITIGSLLALGIFLFKI